MSISDQSSEFGWRQTSWYLRRCCNLSQNLIHRYICTFWLYTLYYLLYDIFLRISDRLSKCFQCHHADIVCTVSYTTFIYFIVYSRIYCTLYRIFLYVYTTFIYFIVYSRIYCTLYRIFLYVYTTFIYFIVYSRIYIIQYIAVCVYLQIYCSTYIYRYDLHIFPKPDHLTFGEQEGGNYRQICG